MTAPPLAIPGQTVVDGPHRFRNEQRWQLLLPTGDRAILAQLRAELADDESVRRRYVYETERLAALELECIPETLATGPQPDPRDPDAPPPWRLRTVPEGESLDHWLRKRAPAPVDESLERGAGIAEAVHTVHQSGAVLRDLEPRNIIVHGTRVYFVDIGLARLDILSTRTASSLLLDSSSYAAPEHLRATVIDPRADIYTLAIILWQALTGVLPFDSQSPLLRGEVELPPLAALCPNAPAGLDRLMRASLAHNPDARPGSALDFARALRGEGGREETFALERVLCQACGEPLRPGLRLCLSCGKTAVQFSHIDAEAATEEAGDNYSLVLVKAEEGAAYLETLHDLLATMSEDELPQLNFVIGDARMYTKAEREAGIRLPVTLFRDLSLDTAGRLAERFSAAGINVKIRRSDYRQRAGRTTQRVGLATMLFGVATVIAGLPMVGGLVIFGGLITGAIGTGVRIHGKENPVEPLSSLRRAPAALPASDPLIRRLAELLEVTDSNDVREQLGNLALLVQRLCDHRTSLLAASGDAKGELELVLEPLESLIEVIERQVRALARIDRELAANDEGAMVRALAASEARGEPRSERLEVLRGLDRLRALEDERTSRMQRLLEAASLLRRTVDMGLATGGDVRESDNQIAVALATLGEPSPR